MTYRHPVSKRLPGERGLREQMKTVLVDCTELWTASASLDKSGFCGMPQYVHGVGDGLGQEERRR
jgi:hypothetical protein